MAKSKLKAPSILHVSKDISSGKLLPVYYLFGEDSYSLDKTIKDIEKYIEPFLGSDFDKDIMYSEDTTLSEIVSVASSFPFGSQKKFVLVKEFEKISNKKDLLGYINSPADFTCLVLEHKGSISNLEPEPYKSLITNKFMYEAAEPKGDVLVEWIIQYAGDNGKIISEDVASVLVEIVGENRSLIETQLENMFIFLGEKKEINLEVINSLSAKYKQFNIFDLQNALGTKSKRKSFEIAFNLLEKEVDPSFIIVMLTKYFTGILRVNEIKTSGISDLEAAKLIGTHHYYLKNYYDARKLYSDEELINISRALLNADIAVKTTSADHKTIITILLTEIFNAGKKGIPAQYNRQS
jgi:DNA polymerase-3 subunit delta